MCGIVGYVGKNKALPILLHSLKSLEYRGYDSSGIAYVLYDHMNIVKDIGKISILENKLEMDMDTYIGIGHTRWATHGEVSLNNTHPHRQGKITLVHNGIIIKVPSNIDTLKPILTVIPLQLIAYEVAKLNMCDIDMPRNLAKSVTVE